MSWQKGWIFIVSLFVLLSPLNLEAKTDLSNMNLLENVETQSTPDELIIRFVFKKELKYFQPPIFYKKSIQMDFPHAYSQPAKQFLTTGNAEISQIYVTQFSPRKMRVRFILGKGEEGGYDNRFHLQKKGNSLTVRVDLNQVDILDQLLARAATQIEKKKQEQPKSKVSVNVGGKKTIKETVRFRVKKAVMTDSDNFKKDLSEKIQTASLKKNPQWKEDKKESEHHLKPVTKASFNFLSSGGEKTSKSTLASSGFKMMMTLSLVLGFIFLLFFGFKKYVLKNTVFGGGKLIQVVSTNYLAPKKNISLVEVAGEILVLGISDQNISLLTSIREPERIEEIKNAHGDNAGSVAWKQGIPREVAGKASSATSNAKNVFSKYLKEFSGSESDKQASVVAVTEKIRRYMGKVRPA